LYFLGRIEEQLPSHTFGEIAKPKISVAKVSRDAIDWVGNDVDSLSGNINAEDVTVLRPVL